MSRPPAPEVKKVSGSGPPMGLIGGVVVLVVALIGGLVFWAVGRSTELEAQGSANSLPGGRGISVGPGLEADVPQIDLYEDFQCPFCGVLESSIGADLADRAASGDINVRFTLMSFLEGGPDGESSARAANAALCADDQDAFLAYHSTVFAGQPDQEGTGWSDEELVGFAGQAGLGGEQLEDFTSCFQADTYAAYVEDMQERANRDDVTGTPSLFIDGQSVSDEELGALLEGSAGLDEVIDAHS